MERQDSPAAPLFFRSTLYAPLAAYQQTRVSPAEYTRASTKVTKELHESTLYKFLHHVSSHHHAKPNQLHAKNTAGKPLKDYEDRIQQRALNLVGGDFYGNAKVKSQGSKAVKRRRPAKQYRSFSRSAEATIKSDHLFLENLNNLWNKYAQKFVELGTELKVVVNNMEWVGALVRIDECPAFRNWKGYKGIIVQHTSKSWHVYIKGQRKNKTRKQINKLLYLPKDTTKLTALTNKKTGNDKEHLCTVIRIENRTR